MFRYLTGAEHVVPQTDEELLAGAVSAGLKKAEEEKLVSVGHSTICLLACLFVCLCSGGYFEGQHIMSLDKAGPARQKSLFAVCWPHGTDDRNNPLPPSFPPFPRFACPR